MASSLYKAQIPIDMCKEHSDKEATLYCKTCKKHICTECGKTGHLDHEWDVLKSAAKERRACLPAVCKNIRKDKLPRLKTLASTHAKDDKTDKNLQELEKIRTTIIETTNKFIDEKKRKYRGMKQTSGVSQKEKDEMLEYVDMITEALDKNVHQYSDSDVLEMENKMMSTLEKLESLKVEEENENAIFIPGHIHPRVLNDMIGEVGRLDQQDQRTLRSVDIKETHTVKQLNTATIQSVRNDTAWVLDFKDANVRLIDNKGNTIQNMPYSCNDFVIMDHGDHVYTTGKEVRVTSRNGSERVVCNAAPLKTIYISKTWDGDLLVSMKDDGDLFTITADSRRLVQRMTMTGEVKTTYEFHDDGRNRLFTYACKTTENKNGDICAINWTSDTGELIILHRVGRVRHTYRGQTDSAKSFDPSDVVCDCRCRIIIVCHCMMIVCGCH